MVTNYKHFNLLMPIINLFGPLKGIVISLQSKRHNTLQQVLHFVQVQLVKRPGSRGLDVHTVPKVGLEVLRLITSSLRVTTQPTVTLKTRDIDCIYRCQILIVLFAL